MIIGSRQQLQKCTTPCLNVNGEAVGQASMMKYLGVHLDQQLTLKYHISQKCRTAMWQLQRIKKFRNVLSQDACESLVLGLVISHVDYANSLYIGIPSCDIEKLQRVQNVAARLVINDGTRSHECLKRLHWLPIHLRIKYKVLTIVYKILAKEAPDYLQDLITLEVPRRSGLRSQNKHKQLVVPTTKRKTFPSRSFSVAAPTWWNELSNDLRQSKTIIIFKKNLKTHLFTQF